MSENCTIPTVQNDCGLSVTHYKIVRYGSSVLLGADFSSIPIFTVVTS